MQYKEIKLNDYATLTCYILDPEISYHVTRKRPAMVICPGGGYLTLATKEGEAIAMTYLDQGFNCFVLRYSTYFKTRMTDLEHVPEINHSAHYPQQLLELMISMKLLHDHAQEWMIDTDNIFTIGFSAGGHVCASLATHWNDGKIVNQLPFEVKNRKVLKPKGVVLGYPMLEGDAVSYIKENTPENILLRHQLGYMNDCLFKTAEPSDDMQEKINIISHVTSATPPIFLWMTMTDKVVNPIAGLKLMQALEEKVPGCEAHFFSNGPHGLARADKVYAKNTAEVNDDVAQWIPLAKKWLEKMMQSD